jgi:hypothetical protein
MDELESDELLKQLQDAAKAVVAHNKYLHAHRYDINKDALRALGMVD